MAKNTGSINYEEDIPAEQPSSSHEARFPSAHAHPRRPRSDQPSPRQGPQASHGERQITHATRMRTLKSRLEFERAFTQGRRYNHPLIRMVICDAVNEGDPGRVAFVAAKRLGCAVGRNRAKRGPTRAVKLPVDGYDITCSLPLALATLRRNK